nr:galactosylceramide sulfotransferase-like isoform X1 [Ciona intestinalis]|eukprot:XP_026695791.1 galactosylceramide sulfotransferase-like isoform X1 [Ciona intestinalis]
MLVALVANMRRKLTILVFIFGFGFCSWVLIRKINTIYQQSKVETWKNKLPKTKEPTYKAPEKSCEPITKIMFMKTHKTASTSVMNIIERYAVKHNLTIALPNGGNADQFDYPNPFHERMVFPLLHGQDRYDVICHHMRFNSQQVNKILPRHVAKYVTILREPGKMFESIFDYFYDLVDFFHNVPSSSRENLEIWLDDAPSRINRGGKGGFWFIGKNLEYHDLGFSNMNEQAKYLKLAAERIEQEFDLVMISDHFMESLILLKDLMCWDLKDVVSLKLNSRKSKSPEQPEQLRRKIRNWNKADAFLFDHFNATLWRKVEAFGHQRMAQEIAELKRLNGEFFKECVNDTGVVGGKNKLFNPNGRLDLKAYAPKNNVSQMCQLATMGTLQISAKLRDNYLRQKQLLD